VKSVIQPRKARQPRATAIAALAWPVSTPPRIAQIEQPSETKGPKVKTTEPIVLMGLPHHENQAAIRPNTGTRAMLSAVLPVIISVSLA
jgi:hypothetical protein